MLDRRTNDLFYDGFNIVFQAVKYTLHPVMLLLLIPAVVARQGPNEIAVSTLPLPPRHEPEQPTGHPDSGPSGWPSDPLPRGLWSEHSSLRWPPALSGQPTRQTYADPLAGPSNLPQNGPAGDPEGAPSEMPKGPPTDAPDRGFPIMPTHQPGSLWTTDSNCQPSGYCQPFDKSLVPSAMFHQKFVMAESEANQCADFSSLEPACKA